jgi:hypothetical protein
VAPGPTDVKAVHRDAHALLDSGILHRTEGKIVFPFDAVRVRLVWQAVAAGCFPGASPT